MRRRALLLATVALAALGTAGPRECGLYYDPDDAMLHFDHTEIATGKILELAPGAPWVKPGADGRLGTADDVPVSGSRGDVDLVVRTGITDFAGAIPAPTGASPGAAPELAVEPFAAGTPLSFVVVASDGRRSPAWGDPVAPPSLPDGAPILAVAFADLDLDGWIGVTLRDGDPLDFEVEEAELVPVGRRFALAVGGRASGTLRVEAGGPPGAELRVVVGAAAYAGPLDPAHFGGAVPNGPLVMTQLPFPPRTDPDDVIDGQLPGPADPGGLAGVEVEPDFVPEPALVHGETWTLAVDGTDPSVDLAVSGSGAFERFGLAAIPERYRALPGRPLRPGLDASGAPAVYEILQHLFVADDGAAGSVALRIVPLDRLGNVADLPASEAVTLFASAPLRILDPDTDGDLQQETLQIADARGAAVVVDDSGDTWDDIDRSGLLVESASGLFQLDVTLPDPDVDDSGLVDAADVALVEASDRIELGDPGFDARLDLTGDGRIDEDDAARVEASLGSAVAVP